MVVTTMLFAHTTFLWATCCLICFIPIVKLFLAHWSWLRVEPFIERGNRAHGGCNRSTGDAYSSMAPDPTSDIFRGPCTPILWFVFPIKLMRLITDRYFCHFISIHSFIHIFQWSHYIICQIINFSSKFFITQFTHSLYMKQRHLGCSVTSIV
jgi:hypothetical protein